MILTCLWVGLQIPVRITTSAKLTWLKKGMVLVAMSYGYLTCILVERDHHHPVSKMEDFAVRMELILEVKS